MTSSDSVFVAFAGDHLVAEGPLADLAVAVFDRDALAAEGPVLVFDTGSGRQQDLDLRGGRAAVRSRYSDVAASEDDDAAAGDTQSPPRRGRPRLGVVGREVTLLPRHWAWLETQRGGASAALRRLVDEARRDSVDADRARAAQDATLRFLSAMAGDRPGFEEASRALYANDRARFLSEVAPWPDDVRRIALRIAEPALRAPEDPPT